MKSKEKNITLIGMPGSGKTTIGKLLSDYLQYEFYDADEFIEKSYGMSIKEIFQQGETVFRSLETNAYRQLLTGSKRIISTGGGAVKYSHNMDILRQNSLVIFLDRDIQNIAKSIDFSTRPLLKEGISSLNELHKERVALYKQYSHITVDCNCSKEEV